MLQPKSIGVLRRNFKCSGCCVLFLLVFIGNSSGAEQKPGSDGSERYATRSGSVIQLHPSEVTFKIPDAWIGSGTWFRLTRRELRKAQHDPWLAMLADTGLNFRACADQ